jgi:hypothetical protein
MKKTSVLFDVQGIVEILMGKHEGLVEMTELDSEILVNILSTSLFVMRAGSEKELRHYWKNASAYMQLEVVNDLVQAHRVADAVLEPLMSVLAIVVKKTSNLPEEMGKDLSGSLLKILQREVTSALFEKTLQASFILEPQVEGFKFHIGQQVSKVLQQAKDQTTDDEGLNHAMKFNIIA